MKKINPFDPNFGKVPKIYLGRNQIVEDVVASLENNSGRLNLFDMQYYYKEIFERGGKQIQDQALDLMTKLTKGYAYAFQDLGYHVWENSENIVTKDTVKEVIPIYKRDLFRNTYSKILSELSPTDRKFIYTMAKFDQDIVEISEIRQKLNKTPGYISQYRQRLIDSQVIVEAGYGKVAFSLPFMKEFVIKDAGLYGWA